MHIFLFLNMYLFYTSDKLCSVTRHLSPDTRNTQSRCQDTIYMYMYTYIYINISYIMPRFLLASTDLSRVHIHICKRHKKALQFRICEFLESTSHARITNKQAAHCPDEYTPSSDFVFFYSCCALVIGNSVTYDRQTTPNGCAEHVLDEYTPPSESRGIHSCSAPVTGNVVISVKHNITNEF